MIVLFCVAVGLAKPQFLTLESLRIILLLTPLILIGAMGQMMVIVARHVDLSIGSMLGFSAMVTGMMFKFQPEIWWPLGFVVSIGIGALLGLLNGVLSDFFITSWTGEDTPSHIFPRPFLFGLQSTFILLLSI